MKKFTFLVSFIMLFAFAKVGWGQRAASATVNLRPAYIDLTTTTSESAVLMTCAGYSGDDARYRLYNGSNQYNCWDSITNAYITSNSFASGPRIPGTPSTTSTFWIMFQRGTNNATTASYRDRLGPGYTTTNQTAALPAATSISTSFSISGYFIGTTNYPNTLKRVVLAYAGTTLISATSTALTTGAFSIICPVGQTITSIEVRSQKNDLITSLTGSWTTTTDIGNIPVPTAVPTKLVISSINGNTSPTSGIPFDVVISSKDNDGNTGNVTTDVNVLLSSGDGTIGGTLIGTIPSGQSTVTISGVTMQEGYGLTITATQTSGTPALTAGTSSPFNVISSTPNYRSKASGNWNSSGTWQMQISGTWYDASDYPNALNKNVTILNGHTILLTDNNGICNNLTVDNGGKLWANSTSSGKYLYVYGNIIDNGIIGTDIGATTIDLLGFDIEGTNCTISGSGIFDCGRVSKFTTGNSITNIVFNMDATLRYTSGSAAALYNGAASTTFNITINAGKKLEIPNAKIDLTNCTLTLKSDATGSAMLLDNGTINGSTAANTIVQQYITGALVGTNDKWHLISQPVASILASDVFTYCYLKEFNELTGLYVNIPGSTTLNTVGKGYSTMYSYASGALTSKTLEFTGALNTGAQSVALTYTSGIGDGWNLVGNPYPSAIDWNAASGWSKPAEMNNGVYFWDNSIANYRYYLDGTGVNGGTNIIPAMQGFFVKATATPATNLGFANGIRVNNTTPAFYKSETTNPFLRLQVTNGNYSDETVVRFDANATSGADNAYDAWKLFADNVPQLYTSLDNNVDLAINTLPSVETSSIVPLNFKAGVTGNFTINATEILNFDAATPVILTDNVLNVTQNLCTTPVYTFTANAGDNSDRFTLRFKSSTGIGENNKQNVKIYANGNTIFINPGTTKLQGEVIVYDILGNQIVKNRLNNESSVYSISLNNPMGYYMVKLISAQGVYTQKVFIK